MLHKINEHYEDLKCEYVRSGVEAATKNETRINTRLQRMLTNAQLVQDKFEIHPHTNLPLDKITSRFVSETIEANKIDQTVVRADIATVLNQIRSMNEPLNLQQTLKELQRLEALHAKANSEGLVLSEQDLLSAAMNIVRIGDITVRVDARDKTSFWEILQLARTQASRHRQLSNRHDNSKDRRLGSNGSGSHQKSTQANYAVYSDSESESEPDFQVNVADSAPRGHVLRTKDIVGMNRRWANLINALTASGVIDKLIPEDTESDALMIHKFIDVPDEIESAYGQSTRGDIYYDVKRLEPRVVKNNNRKQQSDRSHSLSSDNRAHVARPKEKGFRACDMNVAIASSSGNTTHSDVTDDSDAEADDGGPEYPHYVYPVGVHSWLPYDSP